MDKIDNDPFDPFFFTDPDGFECVAFMMGDKRTIDFADRFLGLRASRQRRGARSTNIWRYIVQRTPVPALDWNNAGKTD